MPSSPPTRPERSAPDARREHAAVLRDVLDRLGDKWSITVICRLDGGAMRFNQLKRDTEGITPRMLAVTLRRLERDGLVARTVYPTVPPQVEYALTEPGHSLHAVLARLVSWTHENLDGILRCRVVYDAQPATSRDR